MVLKRLHGLYQQGGFDEVKRGIWDKLFIEQFGKITALAMSSGELQVDDLTIVVNIEQKEDLYRMRGHGERDVLADVYHKIDPSDVFWDIGANTGTYSILGALAGATVEAFEPGDDARERLRKNAKLNDVSVNSTRLDSPMKTGGQH